MLLTAGQCGQKAGPTDHANVTSCLDPSAYISPDFIPASVAYGHLHDELIVVLTMSTFAMSWKLEASRMMQEGSFRYK